MDQLVVSCLFCEHFDQNHAAFVNQSKSHKWFNELQDFRTLDFLKNIIYQGNRGKTTNKLVHISLIYRLSNRTNRGAMNCSLKLPILRISISRPYRYIRTTNWPLKTSSNLILKDTRLIWDFGQNSVHWLILGQRVQK